MEGDEGRGKSKKNGQVIHGKNVNKNQRRRESLSEKELLDWCSQLHETVLLKKSFYHRTTVGKGIISGKEIREAFCAKVILLSLFLGQDDETKFLNENERDIKSGESRHWRMSFIRCLPRKEWETMREEWFCNMNWHEEWKAWDSSSHDDDHEGSLEWNNHWVDEEEQPRQGKIYPTERLKNISKVLHHHEEEEKMGDDDYRQSLLGLRDPKSSRTHKKTLNSWLLRSRKRRRPLFFSSWVQDVWFCNKISSSTHISSQLERHNRFFFLHKSF